MTFKVEVLRTANTISDHIDMMDFLNHNEDPLLKKLGEPYTDFLWRMMADKEVTCALNKFETLEGQVVYMIGMTLDGLDYVITTEGGKEPPVDPVMQHKSRLYDKLRETMTNDCVAVFRPTDSSITTPSDLDAYLELLLHPPVNNLDKAN